MKITSYARIMPKNQKAERANSAFWDHKRSQKLLAV